MNLENSDRRNMQQQQPQRDEISCHSILIDKSLANACICCFIRTLCNLAFPSDDDAEMIGYGRMARNDKISS